jgi:hypothetical protein
MALSQRYFIVYINLSKVNLHFQFGKTYLCIFHIMIGKKQSVTLLSVISFTGCVYFIYSVGPINPFIIDDENNSSVDTASKTSASVQPPPITSEMKRFVWRNMNGGLGNQLFEYAAGYSLARKHGIPFMIQLPTDFFDKFDNRTTSYDYRNGEFVLHHFRIQIPSETEYFQQLDLVERMKNESQVFQMNDDAILSQAHTVKQK